MLGSGPADRQGVIAHDGGRVIASRDPEEMIKFLGDRLSERKLRLFGVA